MADLAVELAPAPSMRRLSAATSNEIKCALRPFRWRFVYLRNPLTPVSSKVGMQTSDSKPAWQLPKGVSRGTWDYIQSGPIAADYDQFTKGCPLMQLDIDVLRDYLPRIAAGEQPVVADFGCGTGRVARCLLPLGYQLVNVDLSESMLAELARQLPEQFLSRCRTICANLVDVATFIEPNSIDMAVCLFSTLGMIRTRKYRRQFLSGVQQSLRPNAPFLLHVHNRYRALREPPGPIWLLASRLRSLSSKTQEYGDRVYHYRGLPSMFLHIYSRRELVQDLRAAGFVDVEIVPISPAGDRILPRASMFTSLRAGGYFAVVTARSV